MTSRSKSRLVNSSGGPLGKEPRDFGGELSEMLVRIAKTGMVMPLMFISAMTQVPGYDPEKAKKIEDQYFGPDGFPITDEEYKAKVEEKK